MKLRRFYFLHAAGEAYDENVRVRGVDIAFDLDDYRKVKAAQSAVAAAEREDGLHGAFVHAASGVFWGWEVDKQLRQDTRSINIELLSTSVPVWRQYIDEARTCTADRDFENDSDYIRTNDWIEIESKHVRWRSHGANTVLTTGRVPILFLDALFLGYPKTPTLTCDINHLLLGVKYDPVEFNKLFHEFAAKHPTVSL